MPPKSTEITKIDTPAASTDKSISTSTISNVTATSHASAFSSFTSYTDQKHRVAFDLDDSIISSNKSLQSDVIIEPSVDDPKLESSMACDRSFGVTPFYSKRMGEERQALMTADAHADFYNAFEDLASTPYITEYLNKQDQVQKRDQGALWVERGSSGTDDIPAFCFDALSPIMVPEPVSPSSPLPKRPKGLN